MTVLTPFPAYGDVLFDVRDDGRALRIGWHPESGIVVLSIWRHGSCVSTCQLDRADVPVLINELAEGLAVVPAPPWTEPTFVPFARNGGRLRGGAAQLRRRLLG